MKIKNVFLVSAIAVSIASPALAKDDSKHSGSAAGSGGTSTELRLSKLKDANVKSNTGENLGEVEDLIINPQNGQIEFAIVGRGGILGIGEKYVPVPWKAIQVTSEKQFTLNVDKQKLKTAPTTDKNFSNLDQPDYTVTVYRFFEVPVETGAAESPAATQSGTSSSTSTNAGSFHNGHSGDHSIK